MSTIPEFVDGRPAKLRSACNACGEAKVRCSQGKPACTRCEKNGISCIYGLSRRSHRTAARIGESSSPRQTPRSTTYPGKRLIPSLPSPPLSRSSHPGYSTQDTPVSMDTLLEPGGGYFDASPIQYFQEFDFEDAASVAQADGVIENLLQESINGRYGFEQNQELLGQNDRPPFLEQLSEGCNLNSGPSSIVATELLNEPWSAVSSNVGGSLSPDNGEYAYGSEAGHKCDCTSRLVSSLLTLQSPCPRNQPPFDVQLSRLRKATKLSERCMRCNCQMSDVIVTVTNSILLYRIIQGFEAALTFTRSKDHSPGQQHQRHGSNGSRRRPSDGTRALSPQLLWGAMQFDQDEMQDLKPHLWLLQFRKLEKLIESLGESVAKMRTLGVQTRRKGGSNNTGNIRVNSYSSGGGNRCGDDGNSAFIMACECIHIWLNQKTRALRDKYLA
ncbi:hypothetical protein GGS21DRAFT_162722 [Xylaria nigripes]|nr:hypothetical protein GGS21DRAFT_162722 [Xylaria nigripes]